MPRAVLAFALSSVLLLCGCTDNSSTPGTPRTPAPPSPSPGPSSRARVPGTPTGADPTPAEPLREVGEQRLGTFAQSRDVVCGKMVDFDRAVTRAWGDVTYLFCSEECARAFAADPKKYTR